MVRNFILSKSQRSDIQSYLDTLRGGKIIPMTPQIRQMRLRARKLDYEEMMADLVLLNKLAALKIPKGRITKNLLGKFNVRQVSANKMEIIAHFEVVNSDPVLGEQLTEKEPLVSSTPQSEPLTG